MRTTLARLAKFKYWQRYVELETTTGFRKWRPVSGWKTQDNTVWKFTENRPWTDAAKQDQLRLLPEILVEPIKEWVWFKGDHVEILVGHDKGKHGLINSIIKERNWCYVEGLHCEYQMMYEYPGLPGIMIKVEKPLIINTEISLIDPSDNKPTKAEMRYTEDGKQVRVSLRTGRIIPLPKKALELEDFVLPSQYIEQPKDTAEKVVKTVTFQPKLKTFEQDIMDEMGIVENRKRAKTFWY